MLYVIALGPPTAPLHLEELGLAAGRLAHDPVKIECLGTDAPVTWSREAEGLGLELSELPATTDAIVFKLTLD